MVYFNVLSEVVSWAVSFVAKVTRIISFPMDNWLVFLKFIFSFKNFDANGTMHYGKVVTFGCKSNHKIVNFWKWFLCQFSPKTWNFLHGPFLTPQKSEDGKVFKNVGMQRGEKSKKREGGVFHRQNGYQKNCFDECYDICFLNICEKHPLVGENCIQSLKKYFTNISPVFWMLRGGQISGF